MLLCVAHFNTDVNIVCVAICRQGSGPRIRKRLGEKYMPLYEFECLDCGTSFETLVIKATEISKVKCPSCEGRKLEEKYSAFASVSKSVGSSASNCKPSGG